MEEIKTRKKLRGSIFRLPEWEDAPICGALFLISRASVGGLFAPGFAFFAAVCDAKAAYIYLPTMLLGLLSAGADSIPYFFASLAFWLITEFRLREAHKLTNALYCVGLVVACGIFKALSGANAATSILLLLIEGIFSGVLYYTYSNARSFLNHKTTHITKEEVLSFILLVCSVLMGLSGIVLPLDINIAQIAGVYLILCVATYLSLSAAVCFAVAAGFATSAASADAILMMGIMASGALFASLLKQYGKYALVTGFMSGIAVSFLYLSGSYELPLSPIPLFFSAAIFLVTPPFLHAKLNSFFLANFADSNDGDMKIKTYIARELKGVSAAFKKLSARLLSTSEATPYNSRAAGAALFEDVTERICSDCPSAEDCWQKNLNETCRHMFEIIDIMEKDGYCDMTNIPIIFSQKCRRREGFIGEFNHAYEMGKQSTLWQTEATAGRDLIARQYAEISSVIAELSGEVELGFYFQKDAEDALYYALVNDKIPPVEVKVIGSARHKPEVYITTHTRVGSERLKKLVSSVMDFPMRILDDFAEGYHLVADNLYFPEISVRQRVQEGQSVSGDTVVHFEAPGNKYYVILCDGMGSGDEAFAESHMTAELLKEFIMAGVKPEAAVKIINSSLALKTRREGFSTADILELDLISGGLELYKAGSAQSYIKGKDGFETVFARNLPLGIIDDITIGHTRHRFRAGDVAVLISDGVGEADFGAKRGEWVKKIISAEAFSPNDAVAEIINDALKKTFPAPPDDMTAVVLRLGKY